MTIIDLLEEHPHDAKAFLLRMATIGAKAKLPDSKERGEHLLSLYTELVVMDYHDCERETPSQSCRRPNEHPLIEGIAP